ncbi:Rad3-related DNA helicase [Gloeomargarita lithophora Alchichica-D10]|uniref:Rad3-related DNA helicase n=1 Tax=Gloeomargarita lithophora Alchichica-D10 TaxID=1188229 RepID=A0A1J0AC63_9CYAN|nr:ATP-dependent DNA helicase [Gloeomargarita lithophora]APB33514.1 Rad3-related DNA helicase [Gloeomargarita lithophora Alchichica-D10]
MNIVHCTRMLEVEVHQRLRSLLRTEGIPPWPHHLTLARLVTRALRLGPSAVMEIGGLAGVQGHYRVGYLAAALLWPGAVVLVAPADIQRRWLQVELPRLRVWLQVDKPLYREQAPAGCTDGLLLLTPQRWLQELLTPASPLAQLPTLIDGLDDLEQWAETVLTQSRSPQDWDEWVWAQPPCAELIRETQIALTHSLLSHPPNPYEQWLLSETEQNWLQAVWPPPSPPGWVRWATLERHLAQFTLHCSPLWALAELASHWPQRPWVGLGLALGHLSLPGVTRFRFAPHPRDEVLHLYAPAHLPPPNHAGFYQAICQELHRLLPLAQGLVVILVEEQPLQTQLTVALAAEFGSRVQRERTALEENGILVTGWRFWQSHQERLPAPSLLVIPLLPIPPREQPLVTARIDSLRHQGRDWFREYLLPHTLAQLQRTVAPLRGGRVALLDSRVCHRSYGAQILTALEPVIRYSRLAAFGSG